MKSTHTVFHNPRPLKITRTLIVLLIAVALVGICRGPSRVAARNTTTPSAVVLQTATVPMLTGTFQVVNDGPGEQTDPHVDCELVSYTNDDNQGALTVRYFDFATNTDYVIPGNGADSISQVYGGLVAFTEGSLSGSLVAIFNTATQTRAVVPGFEIRHSALGGNLVVFENWSFSTNPNESEIGIYDLTTSTVSRLTNDALFDKDPAVSSNGNAIVWEKCQTNGFGCDIYASTQTAPGVFTTRALTGAVGEDRFPDTDGQIAVYISNRSGENDIYFQPLAGGAATHLSIPGDQRNANIAGNLVSFESPVQLGNTEYDIFVYDLSSGNLYQVTNTPVNETQSDITVCNGIGRIVYAAPTMGFNVYAFTFQLPSSTANQIEDLIELIESFNLPGGLENSLRTKLQRALAAIDASDTATACDSLSSFINECQAQSGKKLSADQANQLISSANQITTDLGCQ